ncbi:hypothetical protein HY500_01950 [Candidatus Woesearchaeota archaeon]|nr:hypothetical protein [Candidatus Woesearchaeota archaeon]
MKKVYFLIFAFFFIFSYFADAKIVADIDIPYNYLFIKPGEKLIANLNIYKIEDTSTRVDRTVTAIIIDSEGNKISEIRKDFAIESEVKTKLEFNIPRDAKLGKYRLEVAFEDKKFGADFIVGKIEEKENEESAMPLLFGFIVLTLVLLLMFYYDRKVNKEIKKIKNIELVSIEDLIKKR